MVSIAKNYQLFDLSHSPTTSVAKVSRGQANGPKTWRSKRFLSLQEELGKYLIRKRDFMKMIMAQQMAPTHYWIKHYGNGEYC